MSIKATIKNIELNISEESNPLVENMNDNKNKEEYFLLKEEINNKMLNELKKKLEVLDKRRHIEILQILNKHNVSCTENSNGIFVNLSKVDNIVVGKLLRYIKYLENQEKIIESFEKEKKEYLKLL